MSFDDTPNSFRDFATRPEADAFVEGVEFVNDSALEVLAVVERDGRFVVEMFDADQHEDDTE